MSLGLDDEPQGDGWERWAYGVLAPLPFLYFGALWIITRHAVLSGRRGETVLVLDGTAAVVAGLSPLCLALLLHFHYFWGLSKTRALRQWYVAGKAVSLLGLTAGLSYLTWRLLAGFFAP